MSIQKYKPKRRDNNHGIMYNKENKYQYITYNTCHNAVCIQFTEHFLLYGIDTILLSNSYYLNKLTQ